MADVQGKKNETIEIRITLFVRWGSLRQVQEIQRGIDGGVLPLHGLNRIDAVRIERQMPRDLGHGGD